MKKTKTVTRWLFSGCFFAGFWRLAFAAAVWHAGSSGAEEPSVWRSGWSAMENPDAVIACAKEVGFNALIFTGTPEQMQEWSARCRAEGIESYWWFRPTGREAGPEWEPFFQGMSAADEANYKRIERDPDPQKSGYQWGGDPLPNRRGPGPGTYDVLTHQRALCFHRPEVMDWAKKAITDRLLACPDLTGIALDFFGYQNLRACLCSYSMARFQEFWVGHPDLDFQRAMNEFSRDRLVGTINELAQHARIVRPGVKVTVHVYPEFLPDPLYGGRLDVDTCAETVAWFFEPYWSAKKIEDRTRQVTRRTGRAYPGSRGVPFLGLYTGRPYADKPAERLASELAVIRRTAGLSALSIHSFDEFVKHEDLRRVLIDALALPQNRRDSR